MSVVDARVKKGSLTLGGDTYSCQPTNVTIAPDHEGNAEDTVEVLCGDTLVDATGTTLIANLTMTAIQDWTNSAGLIAFSWDQDNVENDFEWQPSADAQDKWVGKVVPEALTVGGDVGARITSDAEWKITQLVTPPRLGSKTVIGGATVAITGVSAGTPGAFAPGGATLPANLSALKADPVVGDAGTSKPGTAWTTGQWVNLGDGSHAYWNGTAWAVGEAP
jgi:hypothetical protein